MDHEVILRSGRPTLGSFLKIIQAHLTEHPELEEATLVVEHGEHYDKVRSCDLVVLTTEEQDEWGVAIQFTSNRSDFANDVFGAQVH